MKKYLKVGISCCTFSTVLLAALLSARLVPFLGIFLNIPSTSLRDTCTVLTSPAADNDESTGLAAAEDINYLSKDWAVLSNLNAELLACPKMWAPSNMSMVYNLFGLHIPTQTVHELDLSGFPKHVAFRPHGIDVDRDSKTILVVNHAFIHGGERIERLHYSINNGTTPPTLTYIRSITNGLLRQGTMNDIAIHTTFPHLSFFITKFNANELDVANWGNSEVEIKNNLILMFNLPYNYVVYCTETAEFSSTYDDLERVQISEDRGVICNIPEQRFSGAMNGIAMSKDKTRLIVGDMAGMNVVFYQVILPTTNSNEAYLAKDTQQKHYPLLELLPKLKHVVSVPLSHPLDNLVLDEVRSTTNRDVVTVAGIYALHAGIAGLTRYGSLGYNRFRHPHHPNDLEAPFQIPSAVQTVTIDYLIKTENEDDTGLELAVDSVGVKVGEVSRDGAWSVAARDPFWTPPDSSIDSNTINGRTALLGSFIEHYVLVCTVAE